MSIRNRINNYREIDLDLSGMQRQYEQLQEIEETFELWLRKYLLKEGQRLLAMTKLRTPVGKYYDDVVFWARASLGNDHIYRTSTDRTAGLVLVELLGVGEGKQGGTLRRSWQLTNVRKIGKDFQITVFTMLSYAPYVEHGHRTVHFGPPGSPRNIAGWWEGHHMAKISLEKVQQALPGRLQREFTQYLRQHWGDNR